MAGDLAYEVYTQLVLNLPRVERLPAVATWLGTSLAQSLEPVDSSWADALAEEPGQVEELHFQINAARSDAKALAARLAKRPKGTEEVQIQ